MMVYLIWTSYTLTYPLAADMISTNTPLFARSISVPREMSQLSVEAFTAGIVEAALDGLGFVRAHRRQTSMQATSAHPLLFCPFPCPSPPASRHTASPRPSIRYAPQSWSSCKKRSWSVRRHLVLHDGDHTTLCTCICLRHDRILLFYTAKYMHSPWPSALVCFMVWL